MKFIKFLFVDFFLMAVLAASAVVLAAAVLLATMLALSVDWSAATRPAPPLRPIAVPRDPRLDER